MRLRSVALLLLVGCSTEKALTGACDKGDPGACDVLSARYAYGDGVAKDPAKAVDYEKRAMALCSDGGVSPSCVRYPIIKSVALDAPPVGTAGAIPTVFSVVLAADGTMTVDRKPVANDDALLALAAAAHNQNADLRAVIKADSSVPHGRVIHVLDLLKQAQITKIAFGVQPTKPFDPTGL